MKTTLRSVGLLLVVLSLARSAHGQGFNVDFGTTFAPPSFGYSAATRQAGTWNHVGLGAAPLTDLSGNPSGASVTVTATSATGATASAVTDDERLLNDHFHRTGPGSWSVSVAGLTNGVYRIVLYAPTHTGVDTGSLTVAGSASYSFPGIPGDPGEALIEGVSWVSVSVYVAGTLSISGTSAGTSGLAGLQIVPVAAAGLNIDFGTEFGLPADSYGAAAAQPGRWNKVGFEAGLTTLDGLDQTSTGTQISVFATTDTGFINPGISNNERLLNDNFYSTGSETWDVFVDGIANGPYLIFLYAPSHPTVETGAMTVGGFGVASIPGDPGATLIEGVSWVSRRVNVFDGRLHITGTSSNASGLAGLQIVPLAPAGLNIDFGTIFGPPSSSYGAAAAQPGTWNDVGLSTTALVGLSGIPSGANVIVSATSAAGFTGGSPSNDAQRILNDHFSRLGGSTWNANITGLASGAYTLFLYAPSQVGVDTGAMTVNGIPVASIPGDATGTLIEGTSWVSVPVTVSGSVLSISGTDSDPSGLAALQIVPAPMGLNIDFGVTYGQPPANYGAASGQAGVWNEAGLGLTVLNGLAGDASGTRVDVGAANSSGSGGAPSNHDQLILTDAIWGPVGWNMSVSGLPHAVYHIFLYAPRFVATGDMFVEGVLVDSLPGHSGGAMIEGTSWTSVAREVSGGSLTISGNSGSNAGLAALQVVPLPEPEAAVLLASGAALLALLARRRHGAVIR